MQHAITLRAKKKERKEKKGINSCHGSCRGKELSKERHHETEGLTGQSVNNITVTVTKQSLQVTSTLMREL